MPDENIIKISDNCWQTVLLDAEDGSGDGIVPIPDELMEDMGWDENTRFEVELVDEGIVLRPLE